MGNHPFFTLPFCSKISNIVQNEEKAKTPNNDDQNTSRTYKAATIPTIPNTKHPPTTGSKIVFTFNDNRMKNTYDQKSTNTYDQTS